MIDKINQIILRELDFSPKAIIEIVGKGIVNKIYVVTCFDESKYIVRIREGEYAFNEYKKEQWCIEKAESIKIPSPKVFAIGILEDLSYMIQTFVDGECGADLPEYYDRLWEKAGEYAKQINYIKTTGWGLEFKNGVFSGGFTQTWKDYINYNISSLKETDMLISLGVYSTLDKLIIKNIFATLLEKSFNFGLCHNDLSPRNLIVNDNDIYLIDWGSALVNVYPHYDIISLLKAQFMAEIPELDANAKGGIPSKKQFELFLKGYGLTKEQYNQIESDVYSLMLIDSFDKLRWAIDRSQNEIKGYTLYAKKAMDEKLKRL